ncbi:MAG TPA: hypothetical protein PKY77_05860 [Phycisphaerae bacterium]|nr:hypothetical protein [Phycisphaerae bacterium]HRY69030.1 hypothetical protein [Phycisphaerae bacterium]HSA25995.1 hypothetical protein [Phycisphaerae bacterium]
MNKVVIGLLISMIGVLPFLVDTGYGCEVVCGSCDEEKWPPACLGRIYEWTPDPDHLWETAQNSSCQAFSNVTVGASIPPSACLGWHEVITPVWVADPTECKPDRKVLYTYTTSEKVWEYSGGEDEIGFPASTCPAYACGAGCRKTDDNEGIDKYIADYGQLTGLLCNTYNLPCGADSPTFTHECINNIEDDYPTVCTCTDFDESMEMYEIVWEPNTDGCADDVFYVNGPIYGECPSACDWLDRLTCVERPDWEVTAQKYLNENCKCARPPDLDPDPPPCPFTHQWCNSIQAAQCMPP